MIELKEGRISDSLFLLSRHNYWDAIKIAYDILINETFAHGRNSFINQLELEAKGKDTICLLYDFLQNKNVKNVSQLIPELQLLTIFFDNYSREAIGTNFNNKKVKVLTMNLIGLLEFLVDNTGSNYHIGLIDSDLKHEVKNELTLEIYDATKPYFDILILSKEVAKSDFWKDIDRYNPDNYDNSLFTTDEFVYLLRYKEIVDTNQFNLKKAQRDEIEDIWGTYLNIEEISRKIKNQYYILNMYTILDDFRKADKQSGKYGESYKKEKEAAFHKNVYPYIISKGFDLVLSEMSSGNQRYDIIVYDSKIEMSSIIELKVNELKDINSNIEQLANYLSEVEDKPHHYIVPPSFGVLMVYNIGDEKIKDIDLVAKASNYTSMTKLTSNFYLLKEEDDRKYPILIGLYNGKE
jgi:hypothetical protein